MQGIDRLRADLGLDKALANRANSLAEAARGTGQPPPANQIQSLTEDSLDGLNDAGNQLDQAADQIGKQLESANLPRQQRAWSKGVSDMKAARTKLSSTLRPRKDGAAYGGVGSPTGVGPRVMYEAATEYQGAVDNLGSIADQSGFLDVAKGMGWVGQGSPDTPPPPNPGPDPWQEWLRRLQAQQARIRNNISGLNAARALQAGQFQQALQNATGMRNAIQDIQNAANQLSQLASLCNQATSNQQQSQSSQARQTPGSQTGAGAGAGAAAAGGGGGAGALVVGAVVVGAAAGGYAYYTSTVCPSPPVTSNFSVCASGNCSACVTMSREVAAYCDCFEEKHPDQVPANICGELRRAIDNLAAVCLVPTPFTLLPRPAISR